MAITKEEVLLVAKLANIELKEQEIEAFTKEIGDIITFIDHLEEVSVSADASPKIEIQTPLREDKVVQTDIQNAILGNAPVTRHGYFIVPKVID